MDDNGIKTEPAGISVTTGIRLSELSEEPKRRKVKKAEKPQATTKRRLILNTKDGSYKELTDDEEVVEVLVSNHNDANQEQ
jgi:ribosomal protein S4E